MFLKRSSFVYFFLLGVLLIVLPLFFFIQKPQDIRQRAAGSNTITIDPSSNAGPVNPLIWGIGAPAREIWDGQAGFTQRLKDANIKIVRIGGIQYSNMHLGGQTCISPTSCNFSDMDKMMKAIFDGGAEPMYTFASCPGGFAQTACNGSIAQTRLNFTQADLNAYAQFMATVVKHYNVDMAVGQKIRYWEAWNEPSDIIDGQFLMSEYTNFFKTVGTAMKAVDPTIKLVGPAASAPDIDWSHDLAQNSNDLIDVLSWHDYARHDAADQTRLDNEKAQYYDRVLFMETDPRFTTPTGKKLGTAITEYNMAGQALADGSGSTKFRSNYNAVFAGTAFINALRAKASFFTFYLAAGPGNDLLGILDPANNWAPFTPYYAFYLFGNHLLGTIVNTIGPDPTSRLLYIASKDTAGNILHIIIINTDITSVQTGTIAITGAASGSYLEYQLDATHIPTTNTTGSYNNGQIPFTLPPTSIQAFDISLTGTPITNLPSQTISQSPTPTIPAGVTTFNVVVCPHGLGKCGDNANPTSIGNTSPLDTTRAVTVTVMNGSNQIVATKQGSVVYNNSNGNLQGTINMGNIGNGGYIVSIKMPGYLSKQVPGITQVTTSQQTMLPSVSLVAGDINNDNQLDILDYNILSSCFGVKAGIASCRNKTGSDINDDGVVDGVDYNLFLRELSVQKGG